MQPRLSLLMSLCLAACVAQEAEPGAPSGTQSGTSAGITQGSSDSAGMSASSSGTGDAEVSTDADAFNFLERLPGLWAAPVTSWTLAGSFSAMNLDFRVAGDALFGRVDLDPDNSLRLAFSFERHNGERVLVFRNGGQFVGIDRDSRTELVGADTDAGTFTFCSVTGGCAYIEAVFSFTSEERFDLDVTVLGMRHHHWPARRAELRPVDQGYPQLAEQAPDAAFAPLPSLVVTVSWSEALVQASDVWIVLSTTDCSFLTGSCTPSRYIKTSAPAGATSVELNVLQLHPGQYKANAMLDRDGNLAATLSPGPGDGVAAPNQNIEVADTGETAMQLAIVFDL